MDHTGVWLIRIVFQTSFLIGMSHVHRKKYVVFDSVLFCVAVIWFGGCTIRLESNGLVFGADYTSFRLCVLFCSFLTVNIVLFLSLIDFRFKHGRYFRLVALNNELRAINAHVRGYPSSRRLRNTLAVIGFHLLSGALLMYWEQTMTRVMRKEYDQFCAITLSWPTTMLCFQFSCWTHIFTLNFERAAEKIRNTMIYAKQTNANWLSDCTLPQLNRELKMVMRLKQAITDSYGFSILFNQLYTFICLLLNCTLWTYVECTITRRHQLWFRYYFIARLIHYSTLSYIPHWIGQIAFSEMKELLYVIRRLLITDYNTVFDEKVYNCLFSPAFDDLKFRVCNLFDLTNKQFVLFLSISIGFAVIQLQFVV